MTNSEEKEKETDYKGLLEQYAKDLEEVVVELYNKHDFESAERLCTIILQIYEKIESEEHITRMRQILQKLALVDRYYEATFGLLKKQIEAKKEKSENKESEEESST
ncbi:MAG: hypothetical protein EU530_07795 [Promethearchaeota archaeon]|nr:MAG: hypothetical protein EU530_07795 [Candidatus Lokiarchaeota archaeon]